MGESPQARVRKETYDFLRREIGASLIKKGKKPDFPNIIDELVEINRQLEKKVRERRQ